MQRLNTCANDVLAKLDDCKADDLACECCALQSLSRDCYGLCPGSPSGSFLSVLYSDCEPLNDVNACGLPFKKADGDNIPGKSSNRAKSHNRGGSKNFKTPDAKLISKFGSKNNISNETTNSTDKSSNDTLLNFDQVVPCVNKTNLTMNGTEDTLHKDFDDVEDGDEEEDGYYEEDGDDVEDGNDDSSTDDKMPKSKKRIKRPRFRSDSLKISQPKQRILMSAILLLIVTFVL